MKTAQILEAMPGWIVATERRACMLRNLIEFRIAVRDSRNTRAQVMIFGGWESDAILACKSLARELLDRQTAYLTPDEVLRLHALLGES